MNPSIRRLVVLTLVPLVALSAAGCARKSAVPTAPRASTVEQAASGTLLATESDCLRPARGGWASFFPLDSGDVWTYAHHFQSVIVSDSGKVLAIGVGHSTIGSYMLGPRVLGGVSYVLERDVETTGGAPNVTSIYYRQDAHGLYEADVPVNGARVGSPSAGVRALATRAIQPVDRLPVAAARRAWERALAANQAKLAAFERAVRWTGVAITAGADTAPPVPPNPVPPPPPPPGQPPGDDRPPAELLRLSYPLHPGQHWAVRDDPDFRLFATVEAPDMVRVRFERLFGWRIRYDLPDFFGPRDHAHVWYGRQGFLGLRLHVESPAMDESGNVIGTAITDETRSLTSLSLVGAHRGLAFDPDR